MTADGDRSRSHERRELEVCIPANMDAIDVRVQGVGQCRRSDDLAVDHREDRNPALDVVCLVARVQHGADDGQGKLL